jgi:hypothetical protein
MSIFIEVHNEFGCAGAIIEPDGRVRQPYGLKGRLPSFGKRVCPECHGSGVKRLVGCTKCGWSGEVEIEVSNPY